MITAPNGKRLGRLDPNAAAEAKLLGLSPVAIYCDEPLCPGDGERFWAFLPVVPRPGETMNLEDGTECRVQDVWHTLNASGPGGTKSATTYVYVLRTSASRK